MKAAGTAKFSTWPTPMPTNGPPIMTSGMLARLANVPRVCWRATWQAATCPISCAITPASSASSSAVRIAPEFTYMYPPGSVNALGVSSSSTLMVKGSLESELRTRFWPSRLTYSLTFASVIRCDDWSTCRANSRPMATCLSRLYQLAKPRSQPTLRCPMALMSLAADPLKTASSSFESAGCLSDDCVKARLLANSRTDDRSANLRSTVPPPDCGRTNFLAYYLG